MRTGHEGSNIPYLIISLNSFLRFNYLRILFWYVFICSPVILLMKGSILWMYKWCKNWCSRMQRWERQLKMSCKNRVSDELSYEGSWLYFQRPLWCILMGICNASIWSWSSEQNPHSFGHFPENRVSKESIIYIYLDGASEALIKYQSYFKKGNVPFSHFQLSLLVLMALLFFFFLFWSGGTLYLLFRLCWVSALPMLPNHEQAIVSNF